MKKLLIALICSSLLYGCKHGNNEEKYISDEDNTHDQEKSLEERFVHDIDKIIDIETGDEYLIDDDNQGFLVIHKDGSTEAVSIEDSPFFETDFSNLDISEWKKNMPARKQKLLEKKKNQLIQTRKERYSDLTDEELMEKFKKSHEAAIDMSLQIDMIGELVERGAIAGKDAPTLLEIEPNLIDFNIEIRAPLENI